ncbi:MAG TPA: helix-turn-helix domain-containing protein [Rhodothermales bacterium]|nr:helix-turn-helix domain-containing protein [Rhodothermales bacterium]
MAVAELLMPTRTDPAPEGDRWLKVEEAAEYLGVTRQTIYRYCDSGKLRFFRLGGEGTRRFRKSDLDALLVEGTPGTPD